ncbi:type IV pilus modification protein PilV [Franzmannia pantelleriensis]|uniref:type IV pilus modification protein PilV n=1 Tax=Franzmannia pantelleriensis TaxID=48727 RepID=UPI000B7D2D26|nr:type IV pilus modification protein PilV [Halomonas pantelleriensis]
MIKASVQHTCKLRDGSRVGIQAGFTLLEVLVAVVVLSFGLLGLAAMQLKGLQSANLAYQRTIATAAAQDGVERLWAELWSDSDNCPSPGSITSEWYEAWNDILPHMESSGSTILEPNSCEYEIIVEWQDDRFSDEGDVSRLVYVVQLPGGA